LNVAQVLLFALILLLAMVFTLVFFVNALTAVLTFCSLIGYAIIYTIWLKRHSSKHRDWRSRGRCPPVLGWSAVTGTVDQGVAFVLIIFVWTPPHFWALAIHRRR
jgi:protoheme IX farnesyltransferase